MFSAHLHDAAPRLLMVFESNKRVQNVVLCELTHSQQLSPPWITHPSQLFVP